MFNEIAIHIQGRLQASDEPAQKRRKVEDGSANGVASVASAADEPVLLEVKEISVSVPQRKKFELCFTANHLYARAPGTSAPVQGIVYPWTDIGKEPGPSSGQLDELIPCPRIRFLSPSSREDASPA